MKSLTTVLRGTVVNRTYGSHKHLDIFVFSRTIFGPIYLFPRDSIPGGGIVIQDPSYTQKPIHCSTFTKNKVVLNAMPPRNRGIALYGRSFSDRGKVLELTRLPGSSIQLCRVTIFLRNNNYQVRDWSSGYLHNWYFYQNGEFFFFQGIYGATLDLCRWKRKIPMKSLNSKDSRQNFSGTDCYGHVS